MHQLELHMRGPLLLVDLLFQLGILQMHCAAAVREYATSQSFGFWYRRAGIFDEEQARLYAAEIVAAIAHLHSLHIVHRDLKPVSA